MTKVKAGKVRGGSARRRAAHLSRPATTKAVDLSALRIEAGKRGEGWCGCKWKWGDDLVGSVVMECAFHAEARQPTYAARKAIGELWSFRQQLHQLALNTPNHHLRNQYCRWGSFIAMALIATKIESFPTHGMGAEAVIPPKPPKTFLQRLRFWVSA